MTTEYQNSEPEIPPGYPSEIPPGQLPPDIPPGNPVEVPQSPSELPPAPPVEVPEPTTG